MIKGTTAGKKKRGINQKTVKFFILKQTFGSISKGRPQQTTHKENNKSYKMRDH